VVKSRDAAPTVQALEFLEHNAFNVLGDACLIQPSSSKNTFDPSAVG
jgi:hypothetical protein